MSNITASASGPLLGVKILDLTQYQVPRRCHHPHPIGRHPRPPLSALTPLGHRGVAATEWAYGYDDDG